MSARVIIVGMCPSRFDAEPLSGATGARLAWLLGYENVAGFLRCPHVFRTNLVDRPVTTWTLPIAVAGAERALEHARLFPGLVVMLGRTVQSAFETLARDDGLAMPRTDWFERVEVGMTSLVAIPHPSGVSRWWNETDNVQTAVKFMRGIKPCECK